jgi:hypothetical protein
MSKKHMSFQVDERVWEFLKLKSIEDRTSMKSLIMDALREKYPLPSEDPEIDELVKILDDVEIKDRLGNKTVKDMTRRCLEYLKEHGDAVRSDFTLDVYSDSMKISERTFWDCAKFGLKEIADKSDKVKKAKDSHDNYEWKG